jgi:hypothetical protein
MDRDQDAQDETSPLLAKDFSEVKSYRTNFTSKQESRLTNTVNSLYLFTLILGAINVQIRCDLRSPIQVGSDTMTTFNRNDIY